MKKVGISARITIDSSERNKSYRLVSVADNYVKSVELAGGIPFIIPLTSNLMIIEEQVKSLDGIILSGGEDVNPFLYGEEHQIKNGVPSDERDFFDYHLIKFAIKWNKPILGICRGAQILNVTLGGSLYQDLSYKEEVYLKHDQFGNQGKAAHKVKIEKDSFLGNIFDEVLLVNSFHHQAVKNLAETFEIMAVSTDGVIEAFESKQDNLIIGIQWHPEMMTAAGDKEMLKIFQEYIKKL